MSMDGKVGNSRYIWLVTGNRAAAACAKYVNVGLGR